jgi:hypothetical protein
MKKDTEYKKLFNIQAKYYKEGGALWKDSVVWEGILNISFQFY